MISPPTYHRERERLEDLESYAILDTLSEPHYDNITAVAAEICDAPISLISLVDDQRQWFKSHHGLPVSETPKEHAFCAHAINDPHNAFIVQDARLDERFYGNPLVLGEPYIIFYTGIPLVSENGLPLGTLCVLDNKPRELNQNQMRCLTTLSDQVMNLLELRKKTLLLEQALTNLEEKNKEWERFAFIASHSLKSPLNNISNLMQMFLSKHAPSIKSDGQTMLRLIENLFSKLRNLIDGLLEYNSSESVLKEKKSRIDIGELRNHVESLFANDDKINIVLRTTLGEIYTYRRAIEQILINLITNAIRYNDKNSVEIEIGILENGSKYEFYVQDNGPGIANKHQKKIFEIFEAIEKEDKFGQSGNGIGLAVVKKIVEKSGGSIKVESELGKGARFEFTLK